MYAGLWGRYKNGVTYVNRLFSYHNRHWVWKQRTLKENPRPTLMVVEVRPLLLFPMYLFH